MHALAIAAALALVTPPAPAQQPPSPAPFSDIGGVVTGANGPEAGVWVIAETSRSADQVRQDRRHRRSRPLPHSRPPQSQLQRVGARLRAGRFAQDFRRPGQARQPHRGRGAGRARGRAVLPGRLLVFAASSVPAMSEFPGTGARATASTPNIKNQAQWLRLMKTGRLHDLPPARQQGTREIPAALGAFRFARRRVEAPHPVGPGRRRHERHHRAARPAARGGDVRATGPTASPRAKCRRRRPARKGSSAMSSSPSGTGRTPRPICTTKSPPTSAIRRSTPTA